MKGDECYSPYFPHSTETLPGTLREGITKNKLKQTALVEITCCLYLSFVNYS